MGPQDSLETARRVAIDTSPFIYLFEAHGDRAEKARRVFARTQNAEVVVSLITPIEILTHCRASGRSDLESRYTGFFLRTPKLSVVPVTWPIGLLAADLRARHRLRLPDAVQLATAIHEKAERFLTNDTRLKRVGEIDVVVFDDCVG